MLTHESPVCSFTLPDIILINRTENLLVRIEHGETVFVNNPWLPVFRIPATILLLFEKLCLRSQIFCTPPKKTRYLIKVLHDYTAPISMRLHKFSTRLKHILTIFSYQNTSRPQKEKHQVVKGSLGGSLGSLHSIGSSDRVGGGGKKHEIYMAAFGGHLFYDLFVQGWGGMGPSAPHLDPLLLQCQGVRGMRGARKMF